MKIRTRGAARGPTGGFSCTGGTTNERMPRGVDPAAFARLDRLAAYFAATRRTPATMSGR
ncbi:hypothetical protein GCM10017608_19710 [Agromyces luteolus]|nr:hypothetical protein GCM10017608_19710 [Agromyces luteolus]